MNNLLFTAQIMISMSTLSFAMMMLYVGKEPGVYLPIVTGIMGYWLPQPTQEQMPPIINVQRGQEQTDRDDVEAPLLST
jgi:hypothetical protein